MTLFVILHHMSEGIEQVLPKKIVGPPSCYAMQKVKRRKETIDLPYYCELEDFTKNSKGCKIGSSRPPPKKIISTPGPGEYDYPAAPKSTKIPHKIVDSDPIQRENPTINADFYTKRTFPIIRKATIGELDGKHFYSNNEVPSISYFTHSSLSCHPQTIGEKIEIRYSTPQPGPGMYTPTVQKRRPPAFTLAGPKRRCDWMNIEADDAPPPGIYDPRPVTTSIGFTFGERSLTSYAKKRKPFFLLPLGTFIAEVDATIPQKEAREYCESHREVQEMAELAINAALSAKPDNPREFLFEFFSHFDPNSPSLLKPKKPRIPLISKKALYGNKKKNTVKPGSK